jgi:hypothetical protein
MSHEDEERNGRELVVRHEGEDARGEDVEHLRIAEEIEEQDPEPARDERQRQPGHEQDHQ